MKIIRFLLALFLILLCIGCTRIAIKHDYDPKTNFVNLKTFDWFPDPSRAQTSDPTITEQTEMAENMVIHAVNRQLKAKGFNMTSEGPDFLIALHLSKKKDTVHVQQRGYAYPYSLSPSSYYVYEEGTLILDFINPETKEMFWRGSARGVIDPQATPQRRRKNINKIIDRILENFPPVHSE